MNIQDKLKSMEVRAQSVRIHMAHQQLINELWQSAVAGHIDWGVVVGEINATITYLKTSSHLHPNIKKHLDQWATLLDVAHARRED